MGGCEEGGRGGGRGVGRCEEGSRPENGMPRGARVRVVEGVEGGRGTGGRGTEGDRRERTMPADHSESIDVVDHQSMGGQHQHTAREMRIEYHYHHYHYYCSHGGVCSGVNDRHTDQQQRNNRNNSQ